MYEQINILIFLVEDIVTNNEGLVFGALIIGAGYAYYSFNNNNRARRRTAAINRIRRNLQQGLNAVMPDSPGQQNLEQTPPRPPLG